MSPARPMNPRLTRSPGWSLVRALFVFALLTQAGCATPPEATSLPGKASSAALSTHAPRPSSPVKAGAAGAANAAGAAKAAASSTPGAATSPPAASVDVAAYPWLGDRTCGSQTVVAPLASRFEPPAGFVRARVEPGSFGQWLRGLPLRPGGAVLDYRGRTILAEDDPRMAAIVALDEGTADLQQCADSIVRLHAEWLWSKGSRAMSYRAASGAAMPFSRWIAGERPSADGNALVWKASARASDRDDHGAFRKYLDAVFTWANTGALARDATRASVEALRPGDFFVLAGAPGHAVLVLDVAANERGERVALLGQGYMPAQSFHVLRPSRSAVWFTIDPAEGGVQTPFWPAPFPWSSLRRLD